MNISRPADKDTLKKSLLEIAEISADLPELSHGQRGYIIGTLNKFAGGNDGRHIVLGFFFGDNEKKSTKNLSNGEWHALANLIKNVTPNVLQTELSEIVDFYAGREDTYLAKLLESYGGKITARDFPEDDLPRPRSATLPSKPIRRVSSAPRRIGRKNKSDDLPF